MPQKAKGGKLEPWPPEYKERAFQLYCEGKTHDEIAKELKITRSAVAAWSHRYKWATRRRGWLAGSSAETIGLSKVEASIAPVANAPFSEKQTYYREGMATQAVRMVEIVSKMPDAVLLQNAERIEKLDKIARKALNLEETVPSVVVNIGLLSSTKKQPVKARVIEDSPPQTETPQLADTAATS